MSVIKADTSIILYIIAISIISLASVGQSVSKIEIKIVDIRGDTIKGAEVIVTDDSGVNKIYYSGKDGKLYVDLQLLRTYQVKVKAQGFSDSEIATVRTDKAVIKLKIQLKLVEIKDSITVQENEKDKQLDRRHGGGLVLTGAQIANLPDDPKELEAVLKQMAGPGAVIRVNGFSGGKIPPKSQIQEIRIHRDGYAAEYHEEGFNSIDIITRVGREWHGDFNFIAGDERWNARNPFVQHKIPTSNYYFDGFFSGPIIANKLGFIVQASQYNATKSKPITAILPSGNYLNNISQDNSNLLLSLGLDWQLTKAHAAHLNFQQASSQRNNLGVGSFDLPERGFSLRENESRLRVSENGALSTKILSEFRSEVLWRNTKTTPQVDSPALLVLGAFNQGGAQNQGQKQLASYSISESLDFSLKKHLLRGGMLFEQEFDDSTQLDNRGGTYTFSSLADYVTKKPSVFTQRLGMPQVKFNLTKSGIFLQDDVRLSESVSISYGVRHEYQSNLGDKNNFAPRFGIAISPFKNGKTTFRSGLGIFYNWLDANTIEYAERLNGDRQYDILINNPIYPVNPNAPSTKSLKSLYRFDPALRTPYSMQGSISVNQQISKTFRVDATYFYRKSLHAYRARNLNAPLANLERPDPVAGNLFLLEPTGNATQHQLSLSATSAIRNNLYWFATYNLSKKMNDFDGALTPPMNSYNLKGEYGVSSDNIRHNFYGQLGTSLGKGFRAALTFMANSGISYNAITGLDGNGDGIINDRPLGESRNSQCGKPNYKTDLNFSWSKNFGKLPNNDSQGTTTVRVDGSDLGSFGDVFNSKGKYRFSTYLRINNLLNHANFISYDGVISSPLFRRPIIASEPRQIQIGLHLGF